MAANMTSAGRAPISVVLATCNGERFLADQLASILAECGPDDEVLILDDGSRDGTLAILEGFRDGRLRIERNVRNLGPKRTFGRGLAMARHGTIFLADQDDLWLPGRIAVMLAALDDARADVVFTNATYIDADGHPVSFPMPPLIASQSRDRLGNLMRIFLGRAGYYGCAMALRADFRALLLPIPRVMESHDLWIALVANAVGRLVHLDAVTLQRRIHGSNVSVIRRRLPDRVQARVRFAVALGLGCVRRLWRASV